MVTGMRPVQRAIRLIKARVAFHGRCRGPLLHRDRQICLTRAAGFSSRCVGGGPAACPVAGACSVGDAQTACEALRLISAAAQMHWNAESGVDESFDYFAEPFDDFSLELVGDLSSNTEDDATVFDVLDAAYDRAGDVGAWLLRGGA